MNEEMTKARGGCLCGAVRYELIGEPLYAGFCCCDDCRKASGAGAVPYMGYAADKFMLTGEVKQSRKLIRNGRVTVRNFCPACGSLLFGGEHGIDSDHNIYAGTLDDPNFFKPTHAVMVKDRPAWAALPHGLKLHEGLPG